MSIEMDSLRASKAKLRKMIMGSLKQLNQEQIQRQSYSIQQRLLSLPEYQAANKISVYLSMPSGEVSTRCIVEDALRKGKQVFVPYLYKEASKDGRAVPAVMDMVSISSETDYNCLPVDKWGIPTPDPASISTRVRSLSGNSESAGSENLDMIVIPGVAFDRDRRRLGHGKGFYDFFLHRYHEYLKLQTFGEATVENLQAPFLGKKFGFLFGRRHKLIEFCLPVGLALKEQLLPDDQAVPTTPTDWKLDALVVGDGSFYCKAT
ncbi:hypothetical protein MMC11_004101 [Xylographa trunciseda]|nr:hypothetical protein [Xylographa trunciseda]